MEHTYWNRDGKYQILASALEKLVPASGSVEYPEANPKLEKFRKASNCYYDLYNNGLYNRAKEFYHVFGIASSQYKIGYGVFRDFSYNLYSETELRMNQIILDAAVEQGIVSISPINPR